MQLVLKLNPLYIISLHNNNEVKRQPKPNLSSYDYKAL